MRDAGDACSDFTYDGRSFLSRANAGPATTIFADGFETGGVRCWSSADGVLHAVTKDPGQPSEVSRLHLYFAGRSIALRFPGLRVRERE